MSKWTWNWRLWWVANTCYVTGGEDGIWLSRQPLRCLSEYCALHAIKHHSTMSRRLTLYDKGWEDFYPSCVCGGRYETWGTLTAGGWHRLYTAHYGRRFYASAKGLLRNYLPKVCTEITCQRSAQRLPAKGQHREPLPKPVDTRIQWHHSSWPHTMATPHPGIWQQPCCSTTPGGWLLPGLECPNPKPDQWKGVA